jgi:hypothetical protein
MPRARIIQTSFTGGELNPVLYGRVDLETYYKGAAKLENVLILPQGGVQRRPGLAFIDETQTSNPTRLIPFNYNDETDYLLAFSAGTLKVYKDDILQATLTSGVVANITEAMLNALNYSQTADNLVLVHEDLQPIEISRISHTSWSSTAIAFSNIPTYDYGSGLENIISATRGWAKSVTFFGGRMVLGGLKSRSQTMLMSKVEDHYNLNTATVNDDDGIDITISDNQSVAIRHVYPGRNLQVFTSGGEFFVTGGSDDVITPANISLHKSTGHGSGNVSPLSVDGATLFFESNGKVLREFIYSDLEQTYGADDVSILSAHILNAPVGMAMRRSTSTDSANYLHVVNNDGTMAVLNTLRQQELRAWSHFTTTGTFENVTVVGSDVYAVVKRNIDSVDVRHIEKFDNNYYLDASVISTNGSPITSWSGYDHLIGETIKVIGDGYVLNDVTLTTGSFTSSQEVSNMEAGLNFTFEVQTLPADLTLGNKVMTGEYKRFVAANLRLYNSKDILVQAGTGSYKPAFQSFGSGVLDTAFESYNGWQKVSLGGYSRAGQITITQEEPLDFHLMALTIEITI